MGNAAVRLEHYTAEQAGELEDEIVDVAADAYADRAANPFNRPEAFRERLHGYVTRPGFHLVMARENDRAVGLTSGFQLPPDTKWFAGLQVPLPDDISAGDVYALSEIMTRTTHRGYMELNLISPLGEKSQSQTILELQLDAGRQSLLEFPPHALPVE
jgi:hypothetical protein